MGELPPKALLHDDEGRVDLRPFKLSAGFAKSGPLDFPSEKVSLLPMKRVQEACFKNS